jgi:hypothetical protein
MFRHGGSLPGEQGSTGENKMIYITGLVLKATNDVKRVAGVRQVNRLGAD